MRSYVGRMLSFWLAVTLSAVFFSCSACSDDAHHHGEPDGGDTDTDTDTDSDTDGDSDSDWCPELPTSCGEPTALESCGDDTLGAPRLIAPLSGKYVRDRRPEIIWDGATGVSQYRVEIARDRAFTDVVYRSTTYELYPGIDNRFRHIVICDLDCGVHFFRVMSVTAPECEVGTTTYTWEMYVGMAPYDLDQDGVPDIMCWHVEPASGEFENDRIQGYTILNLDEKSGQTLTMDNLDLVAEIEIDSSKDFFSLAPKGCGDVNMDNTFEFGLAVSYTEPGPVSSAEYLVFSNLNKNDVQGKEDAFYLFTGVEGDEIFSPQANGHFSYQDYNGDGFEDFFFGKPVNETYIVFGSTTGFQGVVEDADVHFLSEDNIGWGSPHLLDLNGDGFADIAGNIEDVSTYLSLGIAVHFGGSALSGDIDEMVNASVVSQEGSDIIIGDWNLGSEATLLYPVGDVDFDGFPELNAEFFDAYSSTSTDAEILLSDMSPATSTSVSEMMDVLIAGFFPWPDSLEEDDIRSMWTSPTGDLNDDGIDDLLFMANSDYYDFERFYFFSGKTVWEDFYEANIADDIFDVDEGSNDYSSEYISDIDGDAEPEKLFYSVTCSGLVIRFSSTEEDICIPNETIINYCQNASGFLLPIALN